ncbi:MAG: peptidylprolyl isomerase [Candidatus Methanomethylicota archaeon]|uniref:peptidylprolyl isomerase n=1 Tax=Thermoproteota archaeon TaxID=2056631 RepID=A0A497EYE6_9CREN|nr:MAG: peptidylprolyl isomerase [Candidatus Verstraetearchaeota archaeon]
MPLNKGDFILIDFVAKVKDTGEIFDLTIEEVAKKEKLYREDEIYEPMLVVLGEGWILDGLEEELMKMNPGEQKVVELPPEKAFGARDPSKVKIVPARELSRRGITPRPGIRVEIEGNYAIVRSVGGGRVVLDFNHPLAGKTLVYDVKIVKKLESDKEKILALIHRRIPRVPIEKFDVKIKGGVVTIELPEEAYFLEGLQFAKRGIARDIEKFFSSVTSVKFVEKYTFKREGEKPAKATTSRRKSKKSAEEQPSKA